MADLQKLHLEESCLPVMDGGSYLLTAQVTDTTLGSSEEARLSFQVDCPRFSLPAEAICSVYPPAGMQGTFGNTLSHVVLSRKTLPWERSISPQAVGRSLSSCKEAPTQECPWLWVLLLQGEEIVPIQSAPASQATQPDANTYFPPLSLCDEEKGQQCQYIELDRSLLAQLAPASKELALLAHARQMDTAPKADGAPDQVSVVVGNRLPLSTPTGGQNRAYLVSLEGFGDVLPHLNDRTEQKIRLLVLHSWTFSSVPDDGYFLKVCANLDIDRLQPPAGGTEDMLGQVMQHGYLPMIHHLREGSQTVSLYRGPLTPVSVSNTQQPVSSWCADALYRYDPELGVFDLSYAAAWQLGRLLALSNPASEELPALRRDNQKRLHQREQLRYLTRALSARMPQAGETWRAGDWLLHLLARYGEELR